MISLGEYIIDIIVENMIKEVDFDGDGRVNYEGINWLCNNGWMNILKVIMILLYIILISNILIIIFWLLCCLVIFIMMFGISFIIVCENIIEKVWKFMIIGYF